MTTTIFWLTLLVQFSYRDATLDCKTAFPGEELYLVGEMTGENLTQLQVNNYPKMFPYVPIFRTFAFSPAQLATVQTFTDKEGHRWVANLPLSQSQIAWLVAETGQKGVACATAKPIATTDPSSIVQAFEREGIDDGIWVSYAQTVDIKGTLKGGGPYTIKFRLTQKPYRRGDPIP